MYPYTARYVCLPAENVDTDQIIPARFLKTTVRDGLGVSAFYDWRYDANGDPKRDFVFNRPESAGAEVLVAGHNFGCGSSREHAPWALLGLGLRAVVSSTFADIFKNNSLKNGLLPIQVAPETLSQLLSAPGTITVDLERQLIQTPTGITASFPIDAFAKHCLLNGVDQLGFLASLHDDISAYERRAAAAIA